MSLEASIIHQQEQELLICAKELKQVCEEMDTLKGNLSEARQSDKTQDLLTSICEGILELKKEVSSFEKLASMISETGTRLRAEEALLKDASLWEDGLF